MLSASFRKAFLVIQDFAVFGVCDLELVVVIVAECWLGDFDVHGGLNELCRVSSWKSATIEEDGVVWGMVKFAETPRGEGIYIYRPYNRLLGNDARFSYFAINSRVLQLPPLASELHRVISAVSKTIGQLSA